MPLYLSNTNRIESLQGDSGGAGKGTNSTTTTTLIPPDYQWVWSRNGPGTPAVTNNYTFTYTKDSSSQQSDYDVIGTGSIFFPQAGEFPVSGSQGIGVDWQGLISFTPSGSMWRAPVGPGFEVKADIFGKIATFENTNAFGTYMLASYIPWSSSYMTFEFVPPSSSIQRCVTYPAYTYFTEPITGSGDTTTWKALLSADKFGADCGYSIPCFCDLCYNKSGQSGNDNIINQTSPCTGSILPTTTTSTTTSTTTTSTTTTTTTTTSTTTTSTTTTTAAPIVSYSLEYLIIGGGGGAGSQDSSNNNLGSGGGGAGGYVSGSLFVTQSEAYSFVVGNGGGADTSGTNSSAFSLTAHGGGFGAPAGTTALAGGNGGSGGGGGSRGGTLSVNAPGNGSGSQGFGGGDATLESVGAGGGGGGATSAGSTPAASTYGGGGAGKLWFRGITYSAGGDTAGRGTTKFSATNAAANTGNGGGGIKATGGGSGGSGGSGTVAVRYVSGSASATGGTIINDGGYTYHYFTGSGTFTA